MKSIVPRIICTAKDRTIMTEPNTTSLYLPKNSIIVFIGLNRLREDYTNDTILVSLVF